MNSFWPQMPNSPRPSSAAALSSTSFDLMLISCTTQCITGRSAAPALPAPACGAPCSFMTPPVTQSHIDNSAIAATTDGDDNDPAFDAAFAETGSRGGAGVLGVIVILLIFLIAQSRR